MVEPVVREAVPAVEEEFATATSGDPGDQLAGLTRVDLVTVVRARQERLLEAEAAMAAALAAVGDCWGMDPEDDADPDDPRSERFRSGPDGMPGFSEFAGAEIGPILQRTPNGADLEIRSMLVIRHRHPRLWEAIMRGAVRAWQASKVIGVAGMAGLTQHQARWVDGQLSTAMGRVTFTRLLALASGLVTAADASAAEQRRREEEQATYVRLTRSELDGFSYLQVRGSAHDLIRFNAMIDHIADLLGIDGDPAPKSVRRATAMGILANPALAVLLLERHHAAQPVADPTAHVMTDTRAGADLDTRADADLDTRADADLNTRADADLDTRADAWAMTDDWCGRGERVSAEASEPDESYRPADRADPPIGPFDLWDFCAPPEHQPPEPEPRESCPDRDLASMIITASPEQLRPRAVLYVHVSADTARDQEGVVRVEEIGAVTAQQARDWLAGSTVRVVPVVDLAGGAIVDAYEVRGRLREQVVVRDGFDVFPFGDRPARRCDLDHDTPFRLVGRTDPTDVNPLSRTPHRAKTLGGWRRINVDLGRTEWTSPTGQRYAVDRGRTTTLGPGSGASE